MSEKRNIILITFDSLRADHCSFMRYYRKTTPILDQLAKEGLVFENAIVSNIGTTSSIFGIFTGEYAPVDPKSRVAQSWEKETLRGLTSITFGKDSYITDFWRKEIKTRKTLAQVLSEKGYTTGAFHANPAVSRYFGFDKGFKTFQDFLRQNKATFDKILASIVTRIGTGRLCRGFKDFVRGEGVFMNWEKLYNFVISWVKNQQPPFFLWILLMDTHSPYIPPKKFRCWSNFLDIYKLNWKLYRGGFTSPNFNEREKQGIISIYDDTIRYADSFVGNLLEDLSDYDPIFIITADHGEGFGEHGFYGHPPMLYEELCHVPLIIYNAGVKGRIKEPVSLLGIAPTILELIGEENEFTSKSLLSKGGEWVIVKAFGEKIAVRGQEWKYIRGQKEGGELYNLKRDPREQENLVNEYPDLAEKMKNVIESHVKHEMEKKRIRDKVSKIKMIK